MGVWLRTGVVVLLLLLGGGADARTPPVVDDTARWEAARVAQMSDADPTSRLLILLEGRKLSEAALFALAGTHPGIVEQLVEPQYRDAVDYIAQLPPSELHRARQGATVIRTPSSMTPTERAVVDALIESLGDKPKSFLSLRTGPLEGRVYRVEINLQGKRKQTISRTIELAWAATPTPHEQSRQALSRHFGARPSAGAGTGAPLPLQQPSFEDPSCLQSGAWYLRQGVLLQPEVPVNDISLDDKTALDGARSLRFHGNSSTRLFNAVAQQVPVQPGMALRARAQVRADNLRVEYQQDASHVYLSATFVDAGGGVLTEPARATARLGTHEWEPLQLDLIAPDGAAYVQIEILSAVSGTAWFDGLSLERR